MIEYSEIQKKLEGKKVLITGADGMLGSAFQKVLRRDFQGTQVFSMGHHDLDVTLSSSQQKVIAMEPHIIIHCAAFTAVDLCETKREESFSVQVTGTGFMAEAASQIGAQFLYPQTFLVYGNHEKLISEDILPQPLSHYGKIKWDGEQVACRILPSTLVVRKAGLFGGAEKDKNFVGKFAQTLAKAYKDGISEIEVGDRVWQPTWTEDIALNSLVLLALQKSGVYHMSSLGMVSFFELARKMTDIFGIAEKVTIKRVDSEVMVRRESAIRPRMANLANRRLDEEGLNFQRSWEASLEQYLQDSFFSDLFPTHLRNGALKDNS